MEDIEVLNGGKDGVDFPEGCCLDCAHGHVGRESHDVAPLDIIACAKGLVGVLSYASSSTVSLWPVYTNNV
jgi:hypothetical protein